MLINPCTDISYWQARYDDGKITFSQLKHITYNKHSTRDSRPTRFFTDEIGWVDALYERRR